MNQPETPVSKFESAWRAGQLPMIRDFLTADENLRESLLQLIAVDLKFRWRQSSDWTQEKTLEPGSSVAEQLPSLPQLENYLACFPELGPRDELPVDLIAHEYYVRDKHGDRPAIESYQQRFPQQYPALCKAIDSFRDELATLQRDEAKRDTISNSAAQGVEAATLPPGDSNVGQTESASMPVQTALQVGRLSETFGRYKILKVLGEGGMGAVYLAEDPDLERKVAIKVPFFEQGDSKAVLDRFRREAKSIAALHHPNICPIHEVAEVDGTHYMAMAFIDGKPLSGYVRSGKGQDIRAAVKMVLKIALALHDAHQQGVIHRDLKPDNIMIDRRKEPVIMDFGLARREGKADTQLTTAGQMMGTPSYMPPEQVAGRLEEMGPACDIYSLGVILYELLTGRVPFAGDMLAILSQIAVDPPQPPSTHRAEIDAELDAICQKALEKKVSDRYASMGELAKALSDYAKGSTRQTEKLKSAKPADANRELVETQENAPPLAGLNPATVKPNPKLTRSPKASRGGGKSKVPMIAAVAGGGAALLLLAAIIFYMRTGDGTIRLEINDPTIEVAIKGTDIILKQADEGKDIKLSPGERTLVVQREDFKFETNKLTLKRGEEITVQVELIDGEMIVRQGEQVIGQQRLPIAPPSDNGNQAIASAGTQAANNGSQTSPPPAIAPFDADQAKAHQEAWAKHVGVPVDYTNSIGMKFRLLPPGDFLMGSTPEEIEAALKMDDEVSGKIQRFRENIESEGPQHRVVLTKPIYVGLTEVTQTQYEQVMGINPSHFSATGEGKVNVANQDTGNHPVEMVSWNDAAEFCEKLSHQEQLKPFYVRSGETVTLLEGTGYRLPTEAEWEFACRAGSTTRFWSGDRDQDLISAGWFGSHSGGRTHAAGELKANPFGLSDVHGNVWEWVQDGWDPAFYAQFQGEVATDPFSPFSAGPERVQRGGNFGHFPSFCRSSNRNGPYATYLSASIGFRVVLVAESVRVSRPSRSTQSNNRNQTDDSANVQAANGRSRTDAVISFVKSLGGKITRDDKPRVLSWHEVPGRRFPASSYRIWVSPMRITLPGCSSFCITC